MSGGLEDGILQKILIYGVAVLFVVYGFLFFDIGGIWILSGILFLLAASLVAPITRPRVVGVIEQRTGWSMSTAAVVVLTIALVGSSAIVVPALAASISGPSAQPQPASASTDSPIETVPTQSPSAVETSTPKSTTESPTASPSPTPTPTSTPKPTPTPTPTATPSPEPAKIVVSFVHADADGNDHENLNGEYVALKNEGGQAVEVSGWKLSDSAGHTYQFPSGFTIEPGETIYVHTGSGSNSERQLYWGSDSAVWNNGGDTVIITDASGNVVIEYEYPKFGIYLLTVSLPKYLCGSRKQSRCSHLSLW